MKNGSYVAANREFSYSTHLMLFKCCGGLWLFRIFGENSPVKRLGIVDKKYLDMKTYLSMITFIDKNICANISTFLPSLGKG